MNEDILYVGDEVLCVDSSMKPEMREKIYRDFPVWIKKGDKYIVREILFNDDIVVGILLQNRVNPKKWIPLLKRMQEPAFADWRFVKKRSAYQIDEAKKEEEKSVEVSYLEILKN